MLDHPFGYPDCEYALKRFINKIQNFSNIYLEIFYIKF